MRRVHALAFACLAVWVGTGACIAVAPTGLHRVTDDGDTGGSGPVFDAGVGWDAAYLDVSEGDPHAVLGAEPSHGPFTGGQRVLVHGRGFSSSPRVWFGAVEVSATDVVPIDADTVQVAAPPGSAGPVDLSVQNGSDASTKRTLAGGYAYDAIAVSPTIGPVGGGTVVTILGQGTAWDATTTATIDLKACTSLSVLGPTQLACTAPKGSPGSKTVSVRTGAETIAVLDAYTYEDSTNTYAGGLSGAPLAGKLRVFVYDDYSGNAIPGASVIVGAPIGSALVKFTDTTGAAVFDDASLTSPKTVTVAAGCYGPITFVDEPVDTVTVYLDPVLDPSCGSGGDPPPIGGKSIDYGTVTGELVWKYTNEFHKSWSNVPEAGSNERQAAYVFTTVSDPTQAYYPPGDAYVVTPDDDGQIGYTFTTSTSAGNRSFYALAGIENTTTTAFTAYAMGAVRGVSVTPNGVTSSVFIQMDKTLDQALTVSVSPPAPGPKGPDRLKTTVAVMLGNDGYAILPAGKQEPFLPFSGDVTFVGLPALDGDFTGSAYVATAKAVTGTSETVPLSLIGRMYATSTSAPVIATGFVGVPTLVTPAPGTAWDRKHLATSFGTGSGPINLVEYEIVATANAHWTIAVPGGGSGTIELPDLSQIPGASLPSGPLTVSVYGARIDGFDYGSITYHQLHTSGMSAYALDYFSIH